MKSLRESVRIDALKFDSDNKIPTDIIDYFVTLQEDDDEEGTKSKESTMTLRKRETMARDIQ
ncbi:hypothetical protein [Cytobacillus purgationiresistens]|uniref:Uncharacterized protein n=1 Tax=Cytobacillus purgationiresistens TaxID=863449 RepID=A0ABU0ABN0_9BACI|nr:hypothetical protein [Cytobacillus purgationiresistens]MDQ0268663.1 hypothetical protein [Cytobacillus purgationiresistens]